MCIRDSLRIELLDAVLALDEHDTCRKNKKGVRHVEQRGIKDVYKRQLSLCYHFNPLSLNFLEQEGVEVLVLSDNIDRACLLYTSRCV